MAIQNRRGSYTDFDPSKLVAGEWAVVQSGDPNSTRGKAVYMAFNAGDVERMATYEDMAENIDTATADIQATLTANVTQAIDDAGDAVDSMQSDITAAIADAETAVTGMQTQVTNAITSANTRLDAIESDYTDLKTDNADELDNMHVDVDTAIASTQTAIDNANSATRSALDAVSAIEEIIDQGGSVVSFNGRAGTVVPANADYSSSMITHGTGTVEDALTGTSVAVSRSALLITSGGVYTELTNALHGIIFNTDSNGRIVVTYDDGT